MMTRREDSTLANFWCLRGRARRRATVALVRFPPPFPPPFSRTFCLVLSVLPPVLEYHDIALHDVGCCGE